MLRPAGLLALLYRSDREFLSRRGRLRPSFPEVGHPNPESGMTTQPLWGETVTGLSPVGALPLWAAHSVGQCLLHPPQPRPAPLATSPIAAASVRRAKCPGGRLGDRKSVV